MFDIPYPKRRGSLHDQIFKDLLGAFLPDLVALVAPELAASLDLITPWTLLDKETFTDWPKGKRREVDLLGPGGARGRQPPHRPDPRRDRSPLPAGDRPPPRRLLHADPAPPQPPGRAHRSLPARRTAGRQPGIGGG